MEGILIFTNDDLLKEMNLKVFVETEPDVRVIRRIRRDVLERGRSIESVIQQYLETVRPMHIAFVERSKVHADIIVPEGLNPVALDLIASRLVNELRRIEDSTVTESDKSDKPQN